MAPARDERAAARARAQGSLRAAQAALQRPAVMPCGRDKPRGDQRSRLGFCCVTGGRPLAGGWDFAHAQAATDARTRMGLRSRSASGAGAGATVGLRSRRAAVAISGPRRLVRDRGRSLPLGSDVRAPCPLPVRRRARVGLCSRSGAAAGRRRGVGLRSQRGIAREDGTLLTEPGRKLGAFRQWDLAHRRVGLRSRSSSGRAYAIRLALYRPRRVRSRGSPTSAPSDGRRRHA
jgi:hypothetical protein